MVRCRTPLWVAFVVGMVMAAGTACSHPAPTPAPTPGTGPSAAASGSSGATAAPSSAATAASASASSSGSGTPTSRGTSGSTLPPPATTPVPPPTPGSVNETVSSGPEVSKKPVKLDQPSNAGSGVSVRITRVRTVNAKAQLPGEVAGPGVAFSITVRNGSTRAIDVSSVVVTLTDDKGNPGSEMSARPARPLHGRVAPKASATGVYVFTVDRGRRDPLSVNVTLAGATPVLVFKGAVR